MGKAQIRLVVDNDPRLEAEAEHQMREAGRRPGRWVEEGAWRRWVEEPKPKRRYEGRLGLWRARFVYWYWLVRVKLQAWGGVVFGGVDASYYGVARPAPGRPSWFGRLRGLGWRDWLRGVLLVIFAPIYAGLLVCRAIGWVLKAVVYSIAALAVGAFGLGVLALIGWGVYAALMGG